MIRLHRSDSRTAGLGADEPGRSRLFGCPARSTVERVRGSAFLAGIVLVLAILAEPSAAQRMQTFDARGRQIDLLRAFSTGETICELLFREPARARYESSAVEVNGGRVWWIRELVGDFGGGDSELLTAALGPACRVRRLGEPQPLGGVLPSQPPFADSLAIAGNTFYVGTLDEGLLVGRLPKALKRRREEGIR
jgi:hypothetical protein